jgi:hypothetical protein
VEGDKNSKTECFDKEVCKSKNKRREKIRRGSLNVKLISRVYLPASIKP